MAHYEHKQVTDNGLGLTTPLCWISLETDFSDRQEGLMTSSVIWYQGS